MDRRSSTPEDLAPLELRHLRDLDLREAPDGGGPAHVSAASGVVRRGDFVYVIGDDLLELAVFRQSAPGPGELVRVLEESDDKRDVEALTVLPPFEGHAYGALLGLGSGSAPGRDLGFVCALAADGSLAGDPAHVDLGPLYRRLGESIDGLNVEGACVMGDDLWLLHRGNRGDETNVVAELPLDGVMRSLRGDLTIDGHELGGMRSYDLGALDEVPLTFSDATPIAGDVLVFTASAEAEGGEIRGSVVGTIGLDGDVRRLRTIDRRFKVEGVHASVDTGVMDFVFVCDQDDPAAASPLLSAAMPFDAALERA